MTDTYRLCDIKFGAITPFLVWSEHYGEVLAIIRARCHCDEDTAADISHDLYVIAQRTGVLGRWRAGGASLSTWITYSLRSYLSAAQRKRRIDVDDGGEVDAGAPCAEFSEAECRAIAKQVAARFAGRLHTKIFPLLQSEYRQVEVARKLKKSVNTILSATNDIRAFLRNRV